MAHIIDLTLDTPPSSPPKTIKDKNIAKPVKIRRPIDRVKKDGNDTPTVRKRRKKRETGSQTPGSGQPESLTSDLFFLDVDPEPTPLPLPLSATDDQALDDPAVLIAKKLEISGLLLPTHVTIDDAPPASQGSLLDVPSSPASSTASHIQFLDGDIIPKGPVRYFDTQVAADDTRICTTCNEHGHLAKFCKMILCLTCGAKDEHPTRSCPISLTCWNCGRRGHTSTDCPEPRQRRGCQRCGSNLHVDNGCPTLWRIYTYMSNEEREKTLLDRVEKIGLPVGEGGEGYVAWEEECYGCGQAGHWGFDCPTRPRDTIQREPAAFSQQNALSGPFADVSYLAYSDDDAQTPSKSKSKSKSKTKFDDSPTLNAISTLIAESKTRARAALESTQFDDGYGFSGEGGVGRKGREKAQRQQRERYQQDDEGGEGDWFSNRDVPRKSNGKGPAPPLPRPEPSSSSSAKRRKTTHKGGATLEDAELVAGWFAGADPASTRIDPEEKEEIEFVEYQKRQGGRMGGEPSASSSKGRHDEKDRNGDGGRRDRNRDHRGARDRRSEQSREGWNPYTADPPTTSNSNINRPIKINIKGASLPPKPKYGNWEREPEQDRGSARDRVRDRDRERDRGTHRNGGNGGGSSSRYYGSGSKKNAPSYKGGY